MSKARISIFLFAVLALGLLAVVLWPSFQGVGDESPGQDLPLAAVEPRGLETGDDAEASPTGPRTSVLSTRPRGDVDASEQRKRAAIEVVIPHDIVMDDYKAGLWADIQANPPEFRRPGDPELDADMAYRLYMYYGNCSIAIRNGRQVDQHIERIVNRTQTSSVRRLENLEGRIDRMIDYYELCSPIPLEVDSRMEAVTWMTEAVRLGHEIAEVQFYQKAMGFILRPDPNTNNPPLAMKDPGLVAGFKSTARLGLARALEKGHPEAYLAKSQAVLEGLIYPKDPVLAYAYAHIAELEAAKNHMIVNDIDVWKQQAAKYLGPEQIAEAEQMALEMRLP